MGHWTMGLSYLSVGDFSAAVACSKKATQISADPFYSQFPRLCLGIGHCLGGQFKEAEDSLQEVVNFSQKFGCENIGASALIFLGAVWMAGGRVSNG